MKHHHSIGHIVHCCEKVDLNGKSVKLMTFLCDALIVCPIFKALSNAFYVIASTNWAIICWRNGMATQRKKRWKCWSLFFLSTLIKWISTDDCCFCFVCVGRWSLVSLRFILIWCVTMGKITAFWIYWRALARSYVQINSMAYNTFYSMIIYYHLFTLHFFPFGSFLYLSRSLTRLLIHRRIKFFVLVHFSVN